MQQSHGQTVECIQGEDHGGQKVAGSSGSEKKIEQNPW